MYSILVKTKLSTVSESTPISVFTETRSYTTNWVKTYKVYEKVNKDGELIGYRLKSEDMCEGYDTLREVLHILFGVDLN